MSVISSFMPTAAPAKSRDNRAAGRYYAGYRIVQGRRYRRSAIGVQRHPVFPGILVA